jgi:hypothetical protein
MSHQISLPVFTEVLVRSLNVRAENFGNTHVPAIDIGFRYVCSNKVLDEFDPAIRKAFYKAAKKDGVKQPELDGVDPVSDTPLRCLTGIEMPLKLNADYTGRNIVLDYGLGGKSNLQLNGADANEFKANLLEGGSIELDWRVQISGVDEETIGKIAVLVKNRTKITMVASPESDNTKELPVIDGTVGHAGLAELKKEAKAKKPVQEAGDAFAEAVAAGKTKPAKKTPAKKAPAKKAAAKKTSKK